MTFAFGFSFQRKFSNATFICKSPLGNMKQKFIAMKSHLDISRFKHYRQRTNEARKKEKHSCLWHIQEV